MIKNFKHKGLEHYFTKNIKKFLDSKEIQKIDRILDRLDIAVIVKDMDIPGWKLHELKGDKKTTWSARVNANRRITFRFSNSEAYDVNLEDYH